MAKNKRNPFKGLAADLSKEELGRIKRAVKARHRKVGISNYLTGKLTFDSLGTPTLFATGSKIS